MALYKCFYLFTYLVNITHYSYNWRKKSLKWLSSKIQKQVDILGRATLRPITRNIVNNPLHSTFSSELYQFVSLTSFRITFFVVGSVQQISWLSVSFWVHSEHLPVVWYHTQYQRGGWTAVTWRWVVLHEVDQFHSEPWCWYKVVRVVLQISVRRRHNLYTQHTLCCVVHNVIIIINKYFKISVLFHPFPPKHPQMDLHQIWLSCRQRNHLWPIFLWLVKGCAFCGELKTAISHWQGQSPLTQG